MAFGNDYAVAGQLSIADFLRAGEINEDSFDDILTYLGDQVGIVFEKEMWHGKDYGVKKIKKATITVSLDGINKIRIMYATPTYGSSQLAASKKDAAAILRSYKTRADYSDRR